MEDALKLLDKIKGTSVLCVGDAMIDRYIYGQATRISPEAPVPIVRVKKHLTMPGGVGNVIKNIWSLGAVPRAVLVTGADQAGQLLTTMLHRDGLPQLRFIVDESRPTSVKTRLIAGIQQVVRFDEEEDRPVTGQVVDAIIKAVEEELPMVGAVALSDYGKGVLPPEVLQKIIALARNAGKPVVVDPKGDDYQRYRGATVVTPNRNELAEAAHSRDLTTTDELAQAGHEVMRQSGLENLLITRSEDGVMLLSGANPTAPPALLPSLARAVFDVSGAGDTVVAVMSTSLAMGAPLILGARLANLAAGVVVGKVGTATATTEEIMAQATEETAGAL